MKHFGTLVLFVLTAGCDNEPLRPAQATPTEDAAPVDAGADVGELPGTEIVVDVPPSGRAFVDLDTASVVTPDDDGSSSADWDLAFGGPDVFTNSGPSGPGAGKAFGPLGLLEFLAETPPEVPFLAADQTGGALRDWYAYEGSSHALYSRYHVYGLRRGDGRLFKLQVLGYYGEITGAPVSAVYSVRYAEVTGSGVGAISELDGIDATAGGPSGSDESPSACLDLVSGEIAMLTPEAARLSTTWDVCFRRSNISVNGELGGPGQATAVDLHAGETDGEIVAAVKLKTAQSEKARFEGVLLDDLEQPSLVYRGDRIVSAFSDQWLVPGVSPAEPQQGTWLVVGGDGERSHILGFTDVQSTGGTISRVTLRFRSF